MKYFFYCLIWLWKNRDRKAARQKYRQMDRDWLAHQHQKGKISMTTMITKNGKYKGYTWKVNSTYTGPFISLNDTPPAIEVFDPIGMRVGTGKQPTTKQHIKKFINLLISPNKFPDKPTNEA